jgi:hypothetical protein
LRARAEANMFGDRIQHLDVRARRDAEGGSHTFEAAECALGERSVGAGLRRVASVIEVGILRSKPMLSNRRPSRAIETQEAEMRELRRARRSRRAPRRLEGSSMSRSSSIHCPSFLTKPQLYDRLVRCWKQTDVRSFSMTDRRRDRTMATTRSARLAGTAAGTGPKALDVALQDPWAGWYADGQRHRAISPSCLASSRPNRVPRGSRFVCRPTTPRACR